MARKARQWEPGAIHHVVARAHCGSPIFATDEDRAFVVKRAARAFAETNATCLGWAVLNNHYHVLVRCEGPPGPTFASLNTALAWRVLRYRGEHGSVFQSRYYSDPCEKEGSVISRMAYVTGNPVHHRILPTIDALRTYAWSSLGELLGLRKPVWLDVGAALALLDTDADRARRTLVRFLEGRAAEWNADGGDPDDDRGLGDEEFVDDAPAPAPDSASPETSSRLVTRFGASLGVPAEPISCLRNTLRREGWTPACVLPVACAITGADAAFVRAGAQTHAEAAARGVVAFVACDVAGATMVETAPVLGVGPTALLRGRRRGRVLLAQLGLAPGDMLARSRAGQAGSSSL